MFHVKQPETSNSLKMFHVKPSGGRDEERSPQQILSFRFGLAFQGEDLVICYLPRQVKSRVLKESEHRRKLVCLSLFNGDNPGTYAR